MNQSEALNILKLGHNVFLTGAAGAGKTFVLNSYINYLRAHQVRVAVTASTGIAATHLLGQTIHSWCGFGVRDRLSDSELLKISQNRRLRSNIRGASVLIIDEISMLHARQLNMVEEITRKVRENDSAYGGLQVVLCGDFFQLPPIASENERAVFAFEGRSWEAGKFQICYLAEQHRQKDDPLLSVLNEIRSGCAGESTKIPLRTRYRKEPALLNSLRTKPTLLYAKNVNVDAINSNELSKLLGESKSFAMSSKGFKLYVEALQRSCLAPQTLSLKVGAQVMFVKNSSEGLFVNGTRGTVDSFDKQHGYPIVITADGGPIVAEPEEWRLEDHGNVVASIRQIPLRLAWAMTVHKSQGMTLDCAEIDLSDAFEPGMGYVALSRVRSLAGLKLMGLNELALKVHPHVLDMDARMKSLSESSRNHLHSADSDMREVQDAVLFRRFQGKIIEQVETSSDALNEKRRKTSTRNSTHEITADMLRNKKPISEIAAERGLKPETILDHIERLKGQSDFPDISYIRDGLPGEDFRLIFEEFEKSPDGGLKPIFEKFGGAYTYAILKTVRLFVHLDRS